MVKPAKTGWYNAFRPWSLHGAIVPVALGGVFAYANGSKEWLLLVCALAGGILLQSAANLLNTYGDFEKGLDNEENHSRSLELVSGTLSPKSVLYAGLGCLVITGLLGIYMIYATGWGILIFGALGIAGAGLYTVGVSYKYYGLGQLSVFLMMGLLMPAGTYYLMTGMVSIPLTLASIPNALMITAVLNGNELRDFKSDSEAGIKTQAIRLGYEKSMKLYLVMNTLPFIIVPILIITSILPIYCIVVLLSLWQWRSMYLNAIDAPNNREKSFMLVPLAFKLNWVFGALLTIGYLVSLLI